MNKDVAIIGAGPVGLFGVFACGMQKLSCVVIDSLEKVGGQCAKVYPEKPIYDIPVFKEITGQELIDKLMIQIEPFKPEILLNSLIENLTALEDGYLVIAGDKEIKVKAIIIAAGAGVFAPMKPAIDGIENFEKSVLYYIDNFNVFENKTVAIAGGGDSAIDWAIHLSEIAKKVYLIHRRNSFRAQPASLDKIEILKQKNLEMMVPFQIKSIKGDEEKKFIEIIRLEESSSGSEKVLELEIDFLLPCFGLKSDLNFLSNWNLELMNGRASINPLTCETSRHGIYAIGDGAQYPHKRKLILTGFSEAMQAAQHIYSYINPGKAPIIGHSTTTGIPKIEKDK